MGSAGSALVNGAACAPASAVAVWLLTARSRSLLVRLVVTAAVLVPATALWSGRPLLFGLLGLAAVLLAADGRLDPRWLVPICWVWVNTHGSFPFGPGAWSCWPSGVASTRGRGAASSGS